MIDLEASFKKRRVSRIYDYVITDYDSAKIPIFIVFFILSKKLRGIYINVS